MVSIANGASEHTKNRPFRVSRRCLSTALWLALFSAVFTLFLDLAGFLPPSVPLPDEVLARGGRAVENCSKLSNEGGVKG